MRALHHRLSLIWLCDMMPLYMWNNQGYTIWGASSSKSNTVLCRRRERNESSLNTHSWTCKFLSWCIRYTRTLEANQSMYHLPPALLYGIAKYIYSKCRSNPMGNSGLRSHPWDHSYSTAYFPQTRLPRGNFIKSLGLMLMQSRCIFYTLKSRTWY